MAAKQGWGREKGKIGEGWRKQQELNVMEDIVEKSLTEESGEAGSHRFCRLLEEIFMMIHSSTERRR